MYFEIDVSMHGMDHTTADTTSITMVNESRLKAGT